MIKRTGGKEVPVAYRGNNGYGKPNHIEGITDLTWFGPLQPLPNFAPDDATGRQWDFPVGYNILLQPRPLNKISFDYLRSLVTRCDIMSSIITNRMDQIESRKWVIRGVEGSDVDEDDPRIKELTKFFEKPDKSKTFDEFIRPWLLDLFIIDAPAFWVQRTRGGGVYSLETFDGATVKPLIDAGGRIPMPPNPAFQQILKGVPAIAYTREQLIYSPRNTPVNDVYGRSPVEQTIVTINAAINRAQFNRDYYTEGNVPDAIGALPENFTPEQAAQFTEWWDSMYSGNTAERRKVKFVPGMQHFQQLKQIEQKNVYDDYIARVLCFALGTSPLPFVSMMNRATSDTSKEASDEQGLMPILNHVSNTMNRVIQGEAFFGHDDLEFAYVEKEDQDPMQQMTILTGYVKEGVMTRNEARDRIGEEPEKGVCDELAITTASGIVTLEDADAANKQKAEQADQSMQQGAEQHEFTMSEGQEKGQGISPASGPAPRSPAKKSHDAKKKIHIAPMTRSTIAAARKKAKPKILRVLEKTKAEVLREVNVSLGHLKKDDDETAISIDLRQLKDLSTEIEPIIRDIAGESAALAIGSFSLDDQGIVNQVNRRAVSWAQARAAEMVTQIEDTTRERLNAIIAQGLEENIGRAEIMQRIAGLTEEGDTIFSEQRAELIADFEVGNANGNGSLIGLRAAEAAGVELEKEWYPDDEACPICLGNADAGPIPVNDEFPSGDLAPLAHPNCECSLLGVVAE